MGMCIRGRGGGCGSIGGDDLKPPGRDSRKQACVCVW